MYYDTVAKAVIVPDVVKSESKLEQDVHRKQSLAYARTAQKLFKAEKYNEAAQSFTRAIQENPDDVSFYSNRALCYLEVGNYDSAITDCNMALRSDPKSVKILYRKSLALYGAGRVTEAIECLIRTYSLNPADHELSEINEKITVFEQSLAESERAALKMHISDAKRQVEGWSLSKKETGARDGGKKHLDLFTDPTNPLRAQMLWIGNFVGPMATERELKRLIKPFGRMSSYSIVNKSAYVTMLEPEAAASALAALQGYDFYGTKLVVRFKLGGNEGTVTGADPGAKPIKALSDGSNSDARNITKEMAELSVSKSNVTKSSKTKERPSSAAEFSRALPPPLLAVPPQFSPLPHLTVCLEPLPDVCKEEDLWNIAIAFGPAMRVFIERGKRAGYIEYRDPKSAYDVARMLHGYHIFGFPVASRIIDDLNASPVPHSPSLSSPMPSSEDGVKRDHKVLWLGNLCPEMTTESVMRMFQRFRPLYATVFESSSSGFINFGNEVDAAAAMHELQGATIKGWSMKIEYKRMK